MSLPVRVESLLMATGRDEVERWPRAQMLSGPEQDAIDQRTLARLRAGDVEAFETLFTTYADRLCDYVYRYLRSREDARELVQELFMRVWRRRTMLEVSGAVGAYLYAATRNMARNRLRDAQVREAWQQTAHEYNGGQDINNSPEAVFEIAERQAQIARALAELPERRRLVCTLRWVEGLSYAEIAHRLGISPKTVDAQLQRALTEIRNRLRQPFDSK